MINNDNADNNNNGGGDDNDDNTTNELKQDEIGGTEQKEKSEDEPTFLSVWQEERKLELEKRRTQERELRDDLDAVFKHGTIWEQVGKMVNLNEKMSALNALDKDRFRDLLIHLRNAKK